MKNTLLLVLALFLTIGATAQVSIVVDPGTVTATGPASAEIVAHAQVTNTSSDTIELLWQRSVQSMEHEWSTYICDQVNCYLPTVEACNPNRPNVLAPGSSMMFEVHVNPSGFEGTAHIMIEFFTVADPLIIGTLNSHFETTTTSVSDLGNSGLRIFPNPTTSYFQLSDPASVSTISIYTLVGGRMREFDAHQSNRFDVSDLPEGIYLVRLLDDNKKVLKTVRLSKR